MVFRCKKCFRPIKTLDAHGVRGRTCKETPLRRCQFCNQLEDHNKGKQNECPSSKAGSSSHQYPELAVRKVA